MDRNDRAKGSRAEEEVMKARTPRRQGRCAERILRTKEAVLRIRTSDYRIQILLFSSVTFKMATKSFLLI